MFGIVEGSQIIGYHLSLINATLESPSLLLVVMLIWSLYAGKSVQFVFKKISEPDQQFLFVSACLKKSELLLQTSFVLVKMYLPVLVYSVFIEGVAFSQGRIGEALLILFYHLLVCYAGGMFIKNAIFHPNKKWISFNWFPSFKIKKSLPLFYIFHALNNLRNPLIVTKTFSLLAMMAFFSGFQLDHYDFRVAMLGFMFALVGHCVIVFEFRKFEITYLNFTRAFPVSNFRRFITLVIVYLLLLSPEFVVLVRTVPEHIVLIDFPVLIIFGVLFLLLLHSLLYRSIGDMENYMITVSIVAAASFFLILFSAYLIIFIAATGFIMFSFAKWFHQFEAIEEE
ncbi:MAG: hypothetical protein LH473_06155 [Chitinophagales bacterium]|nr:hypothetical protein [Chitinophagales bacterium]